MLRVLFASLFFALSQPVFASSQAALDSLLNEIWQYELSVFPTLATSLGVHNYDANLTDNSEEGLIARDKAFRAFMARVNAIPLAELDRTAQINVMMQKYRLQNYLDEFRFKSHYVPITSEYGFHSSLASLPQIAKFQTERDYRNYLSRLNKLPDYFQQEIRWMKKGIETGRIQPKAVLAGFEDSIEAFFKVDVTDSAFFTPFTRITDTKIPKDVAEALTREAEVVIRDGVLKAYEDFYGFMVSDYIPASKANIAVKTFPDGAAYYENRAKHYTTTDLDADAIHQIGLKEVARIRAQMQGVIDALEFEGDISAFIEFLRTDPQFYAKTPEELLKHASYVAKQMDARLPQLFYKLPRTPYGVAPVPDSIAPKYTTGRYISPSRDDQPGYYWVNTYALDKRPLYAIPALTLHEAVPGHHLQISLAREMDALPPVRRYTYISAFGEGWGLYSEYLGTEVGIYDDLYDEFGRLSYEMWRACRLVVDTGMHMKGWSRQQALDYMLENTALSEHNVRTEIDRYISWPAQALSYKIGEIEIKRLREKAEQALGEKFDIRAFHDAVLEHGSVPLSVLSQNIDSFIHSQKRN